MPVRLVIFDLDGTLVDTSRDLTDAVNFAVAPSGVGPFAVETVLSWVGEGITRLIEKAVQSTDEAVVSPARGRFLDYYTKHLTDYSRPYPGVPETVEKLGRLRKAVLSNKRESLSVRLLEDLGLARHFDLIAGSDTFGRKKPSPVPVLGIIERLGATPAETVVVGDSRYDIEAARGAGVRVVAVSYGFRPAESLADADYIIDGIQELVPLFISHEELLDRRRETRYDIPDVFGSYIEMKARIAEEYYPVTILNFSAHGFRIEGPVPFDMGTRREFQISAPRSLSKTLTVTAVIRYAREKEHTFIAGAEIESVDDELWFRIFCSTLKFITERSGSVY